MSYKAFRFRLSPTKAQNNQLIQFTGSCRYIFNHFLATQKDLYTQRKEQNNPDIKFLSYPQTSALLTQLKREEATAWSTFRNLLVYKLNHLNGEFRLVDPRHTSQTCPQCLTVDKRNRKSQSKFKCISCGHTANADHNAATNILRLGLLGSVA